MKYILRKFGVKLRRSKVYIIVSVSKIIGELNKNEKHSMLNLEVGL